MSSAMALFVAMAATAFGGLGLAAFLLARARSAPGARPLAAFLVVVGAWAMGLLLPGSVGTALMALAPLGAAIFVHFAARLSGQCGCLLTWPYAVGGAATVAALANPAGTFIPWAGATLFRYDGAGLLAGGAAVLLAALGHGVLAAAWRREGGKRRRQIGVVMAASALGLAAVAGLAFPVLGIAFYPWPLLLLPLYLAVLAYGVLRYELMAANQWARRALTWGLLVAGAGAATALPAGVAMAEAPWMASALVVAATLVREVNANTLAAWRAALAAEADEAGIASRTDTLLRERLRVADADWADAPPGPRQVIELMAGLKAEALADFDRRRAFAERQRLAELGALAATVAHDLRNPMNIVAMAVADAEPAARQEVKAQLARMEALVRDLLDYAKPWAVAATDVDVTVAVTDAARGMEVAIDVPAGLTVRADPLRLGQALGNLLVNARAAATRVLVTAERTPEAVFIHVCDDGPGIPDDIRDNLFQPFVSRGAGGTGLGLAIVAKVMAAHGGLVRLGARPGWTTCFTLTFPLNGRAR